MGLFTSNNSSSSVSTNGFTSHEVDAIYEAITVDFGFNRTREQVVAVIQRQGLRPNNIKKIAVVMVQKLGLKDPRFPTLSSDLAGPIHARMRAASNETLKARSNNNRKASVVGLKY